MVKYLNIVLENKEKEYIDECIALCKERRLCRTKQDYFMLASTVLREKIESEG